MSGFVRSTDSSTEEQTIAGLVDLLNAESSEAHGLPLLSEAEIKATPIAVLAHSNGTTAGVMRGATALVGLPVFATSLGQAVR